MPANKILMIIAYKLFRDEEYSRPKEIFEKAGIEVETASSTAGTATGKLGLKARVDLTLKDVKVGDYQAVVFVGGPGSFDYYDNPTCHAIARETLQAGKVLAAICAAPGILAKAGLLKGKKATMFEDTGVLGENGAVYTGQGVEIDGKIITATGPETAKAFAETIIQNLS
ncbi:MAG: DJ-1/PfpI family protein [Candidatus Margulisbacteria bacterium]|nr:DJ-1/PfpI family protein [Candidatus Margulisiibacteriota bacterium]